MKAIIWAAGLGTRLRPLTNARPKALVPILGKSMLEHNIALLKTAKINECVINTHFFPERIEEIIQDGSHLDASITYSYEEELLENAGALTTLREYFNGEHFIGIGSDNLTDLDISAFIKFHKKMGGIVTIMTTKAKDVTKYGIVETAHNGQIIGFQEKPTLKEARGDEVASLVYAFSPEIFDYIPKTKQKLHFGRDVFPQILKDGKAMYAFKHNGYWNDVGNPTTYLSANVDAINGNLKLPFDGFTRQKKAWVASNVKLSERCILYENVIIDEGVTIADGAIIGPNVYIGKQSQIDENSTISNAVLWENVHIEHHSHVKDSVLATHTYIYKNSSIRGVVSSLKSKLGSIITSRDSR